MTATGAYDVIVIGAGPNGLVCAAYLAKAGKRVLLLERRFETGGGLNTDEYFGYRLNLHAIYHMMGELMPAHRDLGLEALTVDREPVLLGYLGTQFQREAVGVPEPEDVFIKQA